jgi:hypothetical protein
MVRIQQSATTVIAGTALNVDVDRTFKVARVSLEIAAVSTTIDTVQSTSPQAVQVRILNQLEKTVATTGPVLVGPNPRRILLKNVPSTPMRDKGAVGSLIAIDGICSFAGGQSYCLGILTVYVSYGQEEISESCPATLGPTLDLQLVSPFVVV